MIFLFQRDYRPLIRDQVKGAITLNNDFSIDDAEAAAVELASGYLRGRYDVAKVFIQISLHDPVGGQYITGDYVRNTEDKVFEALVDDPGTDLSDTTKWAPRDPRNKALVMIIIDLTLYYLFSAITPRNIPELRVKRYNDAIDWLEKVQKEFLSPDLPLIEGTESGSFTLSSNDKTSEKW